MEDEIRIQAICHAAEEFAPDYDEEKVLDAAQYPGDAEPGNADSTRAR